MSLRDAVPARTIDTSSHDIVDDFFVPMLQIFRADAAERHAL